MEGTEGIMCGICSKVFFDCGRSVKAPELRLRAFLRRSHARQAMDHEMNHRHTDQGFTGLGSVFIVFRGTAVAA